MVLEKYKLYLTLDGLFIILGLLVQIIYVDKSIEITNIFKLPVSTKPITTSTIILSIQSHVTQKLLVQFFI